MKILNKIKKILTSVIMMLVVLPSKIFAINEISPSTWYGAPSTKTKVSMPIYIKPIYYVMVLVTFIIGIIVYLLKSKSSRKRKIITALIVLGIMIIIISVMKYISI